jgi:N-terminal half of MaoC dehydratase
LSEPTASKPNLVRIGRSLIGIRRPDTSILVEEGQLKTFLKAIGGGTDEDASKRAGGSSLLRAPPTYLFCLYMMSSQDSYAFWRDLGIDVGRLLHGEQGFEYFEPVHVGDRLTFSCQIAGVEDKKDGAMTVVSQIVEVKDDTGRRRAHMTIKTIVRNLAS